MAINTKIEWCHHTVNLWWGCSKVHTGCKHCYAEYLSDRRYKNGLWGESAPRKRIKSSFTDLAICNYEAEKAGEKYRVFVGSMMDIFEKDKLVLNTLYMEGVDYISELRNKLFDEIENGKYPNLIFLFLTKRPENIEHQVPKGWLQNSPANVWFGTSISDQKTADTYIPRLLRYKGNNLFLSVEPQVGPISLRWGAWHPIHTPTTAKSKVIDGKKVRVWSQYDGIEGIKWIIQGGESGPDKRPFNIEWAYSLKQECKEAGIPYFFKQIDKIQAIPEDLRIMEFPKF